MSVAPTSPRTSILSPRYDWPRFWIPHTGILDLSDAGFLRDPVDSLFGAESLKTLAELETCPALALLGEPSIGKSATLKGDYERMSVLPTESKIVPAYMDLNVTSSEGWLYRRIFRGRDMESW
jgi:hypothetical protein